jgi:hypothetical protein
MSIWGPTEAAPQVAPTAPMAGQSEPPRRPPSDARTALLIVGGVIVVVLLFALTFSFVVDRTAAEPTAATVPTTLPDTPATPPPTAPGTTVPPPTTIAPPIVDATVIPELQDFVAQQRGLSFTQDVPVALLTEQEFADQYLSTLSPEQLGALLWELQILGLIGTGPDASEELKAFLTQNIAGYYAENKVYVRGEERSPEVDLTIVHELTHALDDQNFVFDRPHLADATDETPFGFEAVIEGSAMNVEAAYARSQGTVYLSPSDVPLFDGLTAMPRYLFGEGYVRSLLQAGGNARVDEAFRTPPATSKQVMETALHLSGYTPVPVEPPPADGEVIDEGLYGQVRFWQLFVQVMAPDAAEELASAWAGDWHVVWVDGLLQCLRVDVATETATGASAFAEMLRTWALSQENAVVEELSSGLVRLTTCAPRPPPPPGTSPV